MDLNVWTEELRQLVNIDCGTGTLTGVAEVADILLSLWEKAGWQGKKIDLGASVGPGVLVTNKPHATHFDVLLVGHLDTVFPAGTVAQRPMRQDDTRIYGPGSSDMKSGLLNILWAMRGMAKSDLQRLSIGIAMNPDEETGSVHSRQWLAELAERSRYVLVCEAARADGSLVNARKGLANYELTFSGVAAHAGNDPEKGRSAITALAHSILAINQLADPERGTTLNVGVVSGGDAANIVASWAKAEVDLRFWENSEDQRAHNALLALCQQGFMEGVTTTITRRNHKPAMAVSAQTRALMAIVERAGEFENVAISWKAVGGGSDANFIAALGIPTLDGFGPVGAGFHSPGEYLEIASIEPRIRLLRRVVSML